LIEDVEENIEPALEPILQRAVYKQGNRLLITIGDGEVNEERNRMIEYLKSFIFAASPFL
jgi:dynein heavy chain